MTIDEVIRLATLLVRPSKREQDDLRRLSEGLLKKTERAVGRNSEARRALLGGSYAKGTWLPDEVDIDIFVKFDPETPVRTFESLGLKIGAEATRGYPRGKKFAQHPYTEAAVEGVKVNVVPCFAVVDRKWQSAADRSPYHVEIVSVLSEKTKEQIRLLKKFMKGVGVYGAEIQTRGFSGYVAEVLVMKHGDFLRTLGWFAGFEITNPKQPLTLPDPVDQGRDLGIAVSPQKLGMIILASREFLRAPSLAFFRGMKRLNRRKLESAVYALKFEHRQLSEDILWGELRKTMRHLVGHLESHGFRIARAMAASNNSTESAILLIPELTELPEEEQRIGPTVDRREDVEAFLKANRKGTMLVWVDEEARVRLLKPRVHKSLAALLSDLAKGKLGPTGASQDLARGLKRTGVVQHGRALEGSAAKQSWLRAGLREITSDAI